MDIHDIQTREDIIVLVDQFYNKVRANPVIGPIFTEVAQLDFSAHLPIMYSFWGSQLLGEQSYTGNPMIPHLKLGKLTPMGEVQFGEWLRLFNETVDEFFTGTKAEEAKSRAGNIARLMLYKINQEPK
ncbi:MAG: group III truncated hemoglobin [Saprospiraceae bacterium]|nr:group III truncated hemoglobin [Saprospiraceae bacterium]